MCVETPKLNLDGLFGAKEIRVRAGEPLNIALGVSGTPDPTVEWLKDGVPVGNRVSLTTQMVYWFRQPAHNHRRKSVGCEWPVENRVSLTTLM